MRHLLKKIATGTMIFGASVIGMGMICYVTGVRINTSRSIPLGLYVTTSKPAEKNDYVLFCPPDTLVMAEAKRRAYLVTGFCPGEYGYMMKKILAVSSDAVSINEEGVSVNGALLPYSAPLTQDAEDRPLPQVRPSHFTINKTDVLLMSDVSATSFDARYFGPIARAQIKTVIRPVFTW